MGCDIHMVLEQKMGGKWVGLHDYRSISPKAVRIYYTQDAELSKIDPEKVSFITYGADSRNYALFGALAGVRKDSPFGHEPLGVPYDVSELAAHSVESYGEDGHSHSWMLLPEFLRCYVYARFEGGENSEEYKKGCLAAVEGKEPFGKYAEEVLGFKYYPDEGSKLEDFRIVFWFDN